MQPIKKIIYAATGLVFMAALAIAGQYSQLSFVTGAQDPSQLQATLNQVIAQQNSVGGGLIYSNATAVTTATTAEETLYTYTLPAGYLSQNGQALRVRCHAQTANTANNKTMTLYFGASTITTGAVANQNAGEFLEYVVTRTGAATQVLTSEGQTGTGGITPLAPVTATPTETLANSIVIKCTATDATAAGGTLGKSMLVESVR